jgi:hypothetical protein
VNVRLTFLSHFCISLACAAAAFFAWQAGAPQTIWANDTAKWFGVAIGAVVVSAIVWLGWQAWLADEMPKTTWWMRPQGTPTSTTIMPKTVDASYGHVAAILCPSIGMLGTVVGLKLSLSKVGDPVQMIASAHTAFDSTGCGIVGMIAVMLMTHSLEVGMRRAGR